MKKIIIIMIAFLCSFSLVACNGAKVESISVVNNSVSTEITTENVEELLLQIKIEVVYSDDKKEVINLSKKSKKNKKYSKLRKEKDLSLATYLDSSRYSKKYLNTNKYRKELKKIAKKEKNEIKEMRKLGYIRSDSINKELKRLKNASNMMSNALSDAYVQKHFLT